MVKMSGAAAPLVCRYFGAGQLAEHLREVDAGEGAYCRWNLSNKTRNIGGRVVAATNEDDLFGLGQRSSNLGSNLEKENVRES